MKKDRTINISFSLPISLLNRIDKLLDKDIEKNRSKLLKQAIEKYLNHIDRAKEIIPN